MDYSALSDQVKRKFVKMVFGESDQDVEAQLKLFPQPDLRKKASERKSVHKNGVKRCPHLNHFTGATGMVVNQDILKMACQDEILDKFQRLYNCDKSDLGMFFGPPTVLIKPDGSGVSPPFVYKFGHAKKHIRYTGLISLSSHDNDADAAGVEKVIGFETYYDLLSEYFKFDDHCQDDSILYFEKWFSIDKANDVIQTYTEYYNFKTKGTTMRLPHNVTTEIKMLYDKFKFVVPETFVPLYWKAVEMPQGKLVMFSSKELIKTCAGRDANCARVYVQIPIQPIDSEWIHSDFRSELEMSYQSGKFGDWQKPGKRSYLKENQHEYNAIDSKEIKDVWSFVQQHKRVFAI